MTATQPTNTVKGDVIGGDDPLKPSASKGLMQTVLRNSVWSTMAVVASPILQFLFGGMTLRYVGVEATGFSLAVAAALGIAARVSTFGIGEAALPAIASALAAGHERRVQRLIGIVLIVFSLSSLATAAAMLACTPLIVHWSKVSVATTTATTFVAISCLTHIVSQVSLALVTILRSAGRYDLVTAITTPLTLLSGVVACILVPLFPSLTTVAMLGLASAVFGLVLGVAAASRAVPAIRRPLLGLSELPALARYGFWLLLTHAFSALTGGVDDLVIAGTCGAAALPPWAVAKRLWLTAHTFLAQHTEHLIPTLGTLSHAGRDAFDRIAMPMHWYVMLLSGVGYTLMAWWGEVIVGVVAGTDVAALCRPAILAYSLLGVGYAMLIIPVIVALAKGASRPAFIVSVLSNCAQIAAVYGLARAAGAPTVYYAPVAALPVLLLATGTTSTRIFDARDAWGRIRPVFIPAALGFLGISVSVTVPGDLVAWKRMAMGGVLAIGVFSATIGVERALSVNAGFHRQLAQVVHYVFGIVIQSFSSRYSRLGRRRSSFQREQVTP
jgi:O-antigen/teichoic acid export membrane protein